MADAEKLKGKLSLYLSTLSDSAKSLLLKTLERGEQDGSNDAASALILAALRDALAEQEEAIPFDIQIKSEFFKAAQPFLSEIDLAEKAEGRISPSSIDAIWNWMLRDVISGEQKRFLQQEGKEYNQEQIEGMADDFYKIILPKLNQNIQKILKDLAGEQKLANQLGGEIVYADLMEFLNCRKSYAEIAPLLAVLPDKITSWTSGEGEKSFAMVSKVVQENPLKSAWAFSAITPRLEDQNLRVKVACMLAGSDEAGQVAATVYAPAITQVLVEMESYLNLFEQSLVDKSNIEKPVSALSHWRQRVRALEAELEISVQTAWGKEIAQMKKRLSELLEKEISQTAGLIRQALRAPKDGQEEKADTFLLQEATRASQLFHHAERMKDSLALNEAVRRVRKELDQTFEILTTSLVERTRSAHGESLTICKTLGEAAVILATHLVDEDYAAAFRRQLRAASQAPEAVAS